MKECFIFIENNKNKAVYTSFQKFRKNSFHYILDFLVHEKKYETRLEAGKDLKEKFSKFYGKNKEILILDKISWEYQKFYVNDLENIYKAKEEIDDYISGYTKINPKKGSVSFKVLNTDLAYVRLSPVYC